MKSTIRLKVRTLILIMFAFIFILAGSYPLISHYRPSNIVSIESENKRLDTLLKENHYAFFNFVNITEGAMMIPYSSINWHDATEILKTYQMLKTDPDLEASYVLNVALTQYFSGHTVSAKQIIDTADTSRWDAMDLDRLELIRIAIALNSPEREIDVAINSLSKIQSPVYQRVVNTLNAYMALALGVDVAYTDENFVDLIAEGEETYARYFESLTPVIKTLRLASKDKPQNTLRVKVTYHGQPYAGALVYQRLRSGTSSLHDEPAAVTNHEGYATLSILEGKDFGIGILMPWQLIHDAQWLTDRGEKKLSIDEVDFQFAFEQGIEFSELYISEDTLRYAFSDSMSPKKRDYRLHVGYGQDAAVVLKSSSYGHITLHEQSGEIPLSNLKKEMRLPFSSLHGNEGAFTLENFLEPLYLNGTYRFSIGVSDENGSYWNGCGSDALNRFIEIKGAEVISEGDRYLESGAIDKAKSFYWADASLHSLNVLEALYWHENDWNQVIKVIEKMVEQYGHSDRSMFSLSLAYGKNKDFEKQEVLLGKMMLDEPENKVLVSELGDCLIRQGRYLEGASMLSEVNNISDYIYWNASLFLAGNQVELLPDDLKALAKRLHKDLDASVFKLITSGSYELAYERVLSMPSGDEQLYLKLLMEDAFMHLGAHQDDFITYYTESLEKIKNQEYVMLLKGIKKAHHWF